MRGIREHGRPRTEGDTLVHAVYLADVLAKAAGAGLDDNSLGDGPDVEAFARAMGELGLDRGRLRRAPAPGRAALGRGREPLRLTQSVAFAGESSDHRV